MPTRGQTTDALPARPVAVLFVTLVLLVFLAPLAGTSRRLILTMLLTMVIFASINLTVSSRRLRLIGFLLGASSLVLAWLGQLVRSDALEVLRYTTFDLLLLQVFVLLLRAVMRSRRVTRETVLLGLSCYLLLGLVWAAAYTTLAVLHPGSFTPPPGTTATAAFGQLSYFSFVTLTTVGYGDILPVTPIARGLANLEATAGVLFVAVFLARLIAAWEVERR